MSENLHATKCVHCGNDVELLETPRPITEKEAGNFYVDKGILFAKAHCPICLARYLAWIGSSTKVLPIKKDLVKGMTLYGEVVDLSYLSTFSDQPGKGDLPVYEVQKTTTRKRVEKIR